MVASTGRWLVLTSVLLVFAHGRSGAPMAAGPAVRAARAGRPAGRVRAAARGWRGEQARDQAAAARIVVNGRAIPSDVPPRIVASTVLVPLRFIGEALGAAVRWDPGIKVATIRGSGRTVVARIGDATVRCGDGPGSVRARAYTADATPPRIIGGRTMLSLRTVGLALGASVDWDARTRTVAIRTDGMPNTGSAAGSVAPAPGRP